MPRRWVWSLLDIAGLICLGQATILAQRQAAGPPPRLDAAVELSRAGTAMGRQPTRIFEAGRTIVVALRLPTRSAAPRVAVSGGSIRLGPDAGDDAFELPVPAGADPARYTVRRDGLELRVIFEKSAAAEAD